jgi:sugar/nucleoside kinase (ribokinase family)
MGNLLVEVMRLHLDEALHESGTFAGPFPSGDTAIYIDAVARLGGSAGFIGAVGQDDFGRCILDRFARDGVDYSHSQILPQHTTGVAFVAYFSDGSRQFIYHWRYAAAGQLNPTYVQSEYFKAAKWLHLTGCNLAITDMARDACYQAMRYVPVQARVSFDPNIRPEVLTVEEVRELCRPVIERADVILPSKTEAMMLTGAASDEAGCRQWAAQGKIVALKQGEHGCRIFHGPSDFEVPSFPVTEVDPTGAGDAFSGGFTVALLEGFSLPEAARFANAVGALAVTRQGPMEGNPTRQQVFDLIQGNGAG